MRKVRILTYIFLLILFSVPFWGTQHGYYEYFTSDSIQREDSVKPVRPNSKKKEKVSKIPTDTLSVDSIPTDSVAKKKSPLDAVVDYTANDSIVLTAGNMGYLYGDGEITYADIKLKAEKIAMNMDSSIVNATFGIDSVGKEFGFPIFTDGDTDYETKIMKYNFKSKKAFATNLITTQGEGYVVAGQAKKNPDNSFYMRGGKYTTCDDHECPHFYLALTKAKVRPKKDVVTGPAYLVIEGLPIPILGLPFAYFPFSSSYSSGVIMPSYGDEMDRGFNLRDGGYYFAINDNIDLALTGDIYTKGSWALKAQSSYRKRYKYSGSFSFNYLNDKLGEKGIDQTVSKSLSINWSHSQDPKANMYRTLSANVAFATSSYSRNSLDQRYTPQNNTKSSSINLNQRIPNSPWSFNANMNVAQRSSDSSVSVTLPNLTITMSSINPFKRKNAVGEERWYEKIRMSYSGDFRNSIDTKEDKLLKSNLVKDWKNGMQHNIPISATFNVLNYLNITPSVNYTERWYTSKVSRRWDSSTQTHVNADTTHSFYRSYDFNTNLSLQTKVYGMFKPLFAKNVDIRHVLTPSITFSYAPDFRDPKFGSYKKYKYYDNYGILREYTYSPFEGGIFSPASGGSQGTVNFQFDNNVEMKIKQKNDSVKKISLIDQLGIGFSYNSMAKSEDKWSDVNTNLRLKLSKSFTINLNATWDPYSYKLDEYGSPVKDKLRIRSEGKGFLRLKSTSYSISPNINQDTFKKWFGKDEDKKGKKKDSQNEDGFDSGESTSIGDTEGTKEKGSMLAEKKDDNEYDADGYLRNEIKWNLSFSLGMNYSYGDFDPKKEEYKGRFSKTFSFSGSIQPTRNWNFNFNATYDFDAKKIPYLSCNLTRNLHCWSISANFIPVGEMKSYYVSLRASSSLLQDLKYEQRGRASSYDPNWN